MNATEGALGPQGRGLRNDQSFVVLLKVLFHGVLLVFLPFLVGGLAASMAEVSQVRDTLGALVRFAAAFLLPVLVLQLVSITVKVRREQAAWKAEGELPQEALLASVYRHVRVMTDKGLGLLFGALAAVVLSLAFRFAELGIMAVLGLSTLYLVVAAGMVLSTFVVVRFEERLASRGGSIGRDFSPVVCEAGDSVEERFHLERVPVPPGFNLRIHQQLPARLETETRHVASSAVSQRRVTLARVLRRTPRGMYRIGPAAVAYSDLFGLTEVSVAQAASGQLKVLPRFHPIALGESPLVRVPEEGDLSVLRRLPTDDHFRFRDYAPGDDSRRLHWKLSVKVGKLQVRLPETVPVTRRKVRLALDTFQPWGVATSDDALAVLADALDHLVEVWLALARALTERGESVTLVLPTGDPARPVESLACRSGTQPRWRDLGARAAWQPRTDLTQLSDGLGRDEFLVVVTARATPLPQDASALKATWVFLPLATELPGPVAGNQFQWLRQRFPPGATENGVWVGFQRGRARMNLELARQRVMRILGGGSLASEAQLRSRGEPFYKVSRAGLTYLLGAP
ncbi:MAG: DUF58 domain-containing protein [Deltaproteobacteria bacterium]|nr:DUF58 domain-containing protein [Deltaproteobacteria bacterium]